jgi:hypothetical protein
MKQAVGKINPGEGFEASCFDGVYITGDISDEEVTALNEGRNRGGEEERKTLRACRCPMPRKAERPCAGGRAPLAWQKRELQHGCADYQDFDNVSC